MQIRRARSSAALAHIKDRILETGEMSKENYLSCLAWRLNDPEASKSTFIIVIIDEEKKNKVIGHLVAVAEPLVSHTFVYEAEYDSKISLEQAVEVTSKTRDAIVSWTTSLNRSSIRIQTKRDPQAWERKWGFKQIATVLEYRLDSILNNAIFEELQLSNPQPENHDGRRRNNNQGIGTDARPEANDNTSEPVDSGSGPERPGECDSQSSASGSGSGELRELSDVQRAAAREDSSRNDGPRDDGSAVKPTSELSEFHERYLSSVERTEGV